MKDSEGSQGPPKESGQVPQPGIPITEEELQKIKERLGQKNKPQNIPSIKEGWETISKDDFFKVHQAPCSREGFLTGIGGGAAIGALRYIIGAPIPKAANWAVFCGVGLAIVRYEVCQIYRREEHAKVKRVVKVQNDKQMEIRRQEEARRSQKFAEEEAAKAKKSWYKFW